MQSRAPTIRSPIMTTRWANVRQEKVNRKDATLHSVTPSTVVFYRFEVKQILTSPQIQIPAQKVAGSMDHCLWAAFAGVRSQGIAGPERC